MALARLQAILACITCGTTEVNASSYSFEKTPLLTEPDMRPESEVADDVANTILNTSYSGPMLRMKLDSIVGVRGWRQSLAQLVLDKLAQALQTMHEKLGPRINDAYNRACEVALGIEGFATEHPVMCTVIALGVLALLAPCILEALGFTELGPTAGKLSLK